MYLNWALYLFQCPFVILNRVKSSNILKWVPHKKLSTLIPPIVVQIMMNVPIFGANSGHHTIQMDELCVKYLSDALEVTSSLSCHILIKYPMPIGDQFKSQVVKRTFYHVTIPAYLAVNLMFLSPKKEHKFWETSSILVNPYLSKCHLPIPHA